MNSKRSSSRSSKNQALRAPGGQLAPQLAAYSATAAAALALAPTTQAQVVNITQFTFHGAPTTTPPSINFPPQYVLSSLTVVNFTAGPFRGQLQGALGGHGGTTVGKALISGTVATDGVFNYVKILKASSHLNAQLFKGSSHYLALKNSGGTHGQLVPTANNHKTGYVGFKVQQNSHNYYGWFVAEVTADANGFPNSISLAAKPGSPGIFGAYDISTDVNIANFKAGDIALVAVPEPSTAAFGLGLLAFGAAGVREWRKRRKMLA